GSTRTPIYVPRSVFFFLLIRPPPRSTLFPTRRSSDLVAVHQQHCDLAVDDAPAHGARCEYGLLAHRRTPARIRSAGGMSAIFCMITFCRSRSGVPSCLRWFLVHVPSGPSAHVAVSSEMVRSSRSLMR